MRRELLLEGWMMAERFLKAKENPALQNQRVRRLSRICTEADYLQAHLTVITRRPRGGALTMSTAVQRVIRNFMRLSELRSRNATAVSAGEKHPL
jgi:hypothetical protein